MIWINILRAFLPIRQPFRTRFARGTSTAGSVGRTTTLPPRVRPKRRPCLVSPSATMLFLSRRFSRVRSATASLRAAASTSKVFHLWAPLRRENDPPDRFLTLLKPGVRYRPQGTMRRRSRHHLHEAHHAARHPEVPPTRRAAPVVDLLARHVEPPRDVRDHRPGLQRRHRHRQLLVHVPPAAALDPAQNLPRIDTSNPSGRP